MKRSLRGSSLLAAAVLTACGLPTVPSGRETPSQATVVPSAWRGGNAEGRSLAEPSWREVFDYNELPALIEEALRNNRDLRIAAERMALAQAQFGIARSALYPSVAATANATAQRAPSALDAERNRRSESYSAGLSVPAWEIDLWGRIRDQVSSAQRTLESAEAQRYAAQVSLVASVANGYLQLLELDQQARISVRTRDARRDSLRIIRLRFEAGVVSKVDLTQAETSLAQAEQALAEIERQRSIAESGLSLLLGRSPGPIARTRTLPEIPVPRALPAGLPSDLLQRRPDVVAAERTMAASAADVEVARKAFLPSFTLTGFLGVVSPQFSQWLSTDRGAWSVVPGVTLPVFTGGRLDANLEAAAARQRIAVEEYGRTVQSALRDVEDALTGFQRRREQSEALGRIVASSRERLRLVELRYLNGISSYFEVLDSQRVLFDAELQQTQASAATYGSVIQLYRALGGGWDPAALAPTASASAPTR